jgi:hypothetical protein
MSRDRANVARFDASSHPVFNTFRLARHQHIRGFMNANAIAARNESMLTYIGCSFTDGDTLNEVSPLCGPCVELAGYRDEMDVAFDMHAERLGCDGLVVVHQISDAEGDTWAEAGRAIAVEHFDDFARALSANDPRRGMTQWLLLSEVAYEIEMHIDSTAG